MAPGLREPCSAPAPARAETLRGWWEQGGFVRRSARHSSYACWGRWWAQAPASARGPIEIGFPNPYRTLSATPYPIPGPAEGRIPVSLRLADSWTDDGSPPSAATAVRVGESAIAYRGKRNKLLIHTYVLAPVSGEVVIPIELSQTSDCRYGLIATASIPKLADGSGSLTYLGLRFRKGLFSAACPKRRLQSRVTDTFTDGTRAV